MPVQLHDEVSVYHARGTGPRAGTASLFLQLFGTLADGSGCGTDHARAEMVFAYPPQDDLPNGGLRFFVHR
jgi:hypothetical protein